MNLKSSLVVGGLIVAMSWGGTLASARQAGPQGAGRQAPAQGAGAQGMGPGMRGGGGLGQMTPAELERWVDSYVLLQAQEALKLSDAQYPKFVQRLKALQDQRRHYLQMRRQMVATLGGLLKATPVDETALRERLKAIHDLDVRAAAELQTLRDAIDEVLDVPQQARFRLFEETVERRKIELLMRARMGARRGVQGGPGGLW